MAFSLQCLHNFQGGIGVVGCVAQLRGAELAKRPVAGGDGFGFLEAQLEQHTHGSTDTDLAAVAKLAKALIKVEHMVEGDSQPMTDLAMIILQAEAHLEDTLGGDKLGSGFLALTSMELKDKGFVSKGKLHDVGTVTFLPFSKSRLSLSVESANPRGKDFGDRFFAFGWGPRNVNLFRGKALEGR